ncbi:ORF6N domain-containing protein [Halobacteriovorax sp. ZH4_bin.1]|uniref:ORF6N domain-containing protein n=1 Tax=unclassified Halobacteriovorax TaxID=2639665 RepID=UPI0037102CE7
MDIKLDQIQNMIYVIRGQKVMLDSDLAKLYGVETKVLNQSVKRNIKRFPDDFMFQLTSGEHEALRSQIVTSKEGKGGRRYQPLVFTESGIAMLSSVLKSDIAIDINIAIMRVFIKLRSFYVFESKLDQKVGRLEEDVTKVFKVVFERLDKLEEKIPTYDSNRRKIGLKPKK